MQPRLEVLTELDDAEIAQVAVVVEQATEADGVRPLSEQAVLDLRHDGAGPVRHVLGYLGDELVGYAHVDPSDTVGGTSAEIVVAPAARRRGVGRALVAEALALSPDGGLRLWAHGDRPAASALAGVFGMTRARVLLQLRRSLLAALPAAAVPQGVDVRTFRPGRDDEEWVRLNAIVFAHHPEQGRWTVGDLRARMAEPWFDPAGFFLAERTGPRRLVGFHWTKIPLAQLGTDDGAPPPVPGEVYVVGVDAAERGAGLGRALTLVGLHHLRSRGRTEAMLYVDADNRGAVRLYEELGFTPWSSDIMFST